MAKQYNADLFVKNGGLSTEVLMADGGVSPSSDFVNETSTFLPINTSGAFTDSPFYTLPVFEGYEGFGGIGTKSTMYNGVPPEAGVPAYSNFGLEIQSFLDFAEQSSVSLGDYAQSIYGGLGEFYWYTGSPLTYDPSGNPSPVLPYASSGINFSTYEYNLFEVSWNYFKLDAKTGNPSLVDGLLYNTNSGIIGFGAGLDVNTRSSSENSIIWDLYTGIFKIKGVFSDDILVSDSGAGLTFIAENSSRIGLNSGAMYISNDLAVTTTVSGSYTKVLHVIDASGNSYAIKLHTY